MKWSFLAAESKGHGGEFETQNCYPAMFMNACKQATQTSEPKEDTAHCTANTKLQARRQQLAASLRRHWQDHLNVLMLRTAYKCLHGIQMTIILTLVAVTHSVSIKATLRGKFYCLEAPKGFYFVVYIINHWLVSISWVVLGCWLRFENVTANGQSQ